MSMIADAFEALLRDHCSPTWVRQVETGQSPQALWDRIAEAGFQDLLVPEASGGAGQPLAELYPLLLACGRHAVPLPVGQTVAARALLGAEWRREGAQGQALTGPVTLATHLQRGTAGALRCPLVPFGQVCRQVLVCDDQGWLILDAARARRTPTGVAGSLMATLEWNADGVLAQGREDLRAAVESWGAALHAALIAGALNRVFEMTLAHCNVREQFGRPLGRFQAVQHQLAVMAEQVAAASIAAEASFQQARLPAASSTGTAENPPPGAGSGPVPALWPAAMAKARASEAAAEGAAIAHALHGAIGITAEYDLQLHTRRLHEWRTAHGSEDHWHRRLGQAVLAQPGPLSDFVRSA